MAYQREWNYAVDSPLAPTQKGLQSQDEACVQLLNLVERADMGAGYQFWQIKAMSAIETRRNDISAKMVELKQKG